MTLEERSGLLKQYGFLKPHAGCLVLKAVTSNETTSGMIKSGNEESRAYGRVVAIEEEGLFFIGDLVCYNEYEGQELHKFGNMIKEDFLIVIKEEDVLLTIDEDYEFIQQVEAGDEKRRSEEEGGDTGEDRGDSQ